VEPERQNNLSYPAGHYKHAASTSRKQMRLICLHCCRRQATGHHTALCINASANLRQAEAALQAPNLSPASLLSLTRCLLRSLTTRNAAPNIMMLPRTRPPCECRIRWHHCRHKHGMSKQVLYQLQLTCKSRTRHAIAEQHHNSHVFVNTRNAVSAVALCKT
jgi:hypothetical protein